MIVADASAIVAAISGDGQQAELIRDRIEREDELCAPHLVDLEVLQALRRAVRHGELSADRAFDGVQALAELALTRFPHEPFTERIWELRDTLSAYDAVYLALTEAIGGPLVTCDAALAEVAGASAEVELYAPD